MSIAYYCVLIVSLVHVTLVHGETIYQKGLCPGNMTTGHRWQVEDGCIECFCVPEGFGCTGCGMLPTPPPGCQLVMNKTAPHPDCCPHLECPLLG